VTAVTVTTIAVAFEAAVTVTAHCATATVGGLRSRGWRARVLRRRESQARDRPLHEA